MSTMKFARGVLIAALCTQLSGCFVFMIPLPKAKPAPQQESALRVVQH